MATHSSLLIPASGRWAQIPVLCSGINSYSWMRIWRGQYHWKRSLLFTVPQEMRGTAHGEGPHETCHMQEQGSRERTGTVSLLLRQWARRENTHSIMCGLGGLWYDFHVPMRANVQRRCKELQGHYFCPVINGCQVDNKVWEHTISTAPGAACGSKVSNKDPALQIMGICILIVDSYF